MKKHITILCLAALCIGALASCTAASDENKDNVVTAAPLTTKPAESEAETDESAAEEETKSETDTETETIGETASETETEPETAHEHTTEVLSAVEPTCVKTGLTEGSHCPGCGLIYTEQEEIPATGKHTWDDNGVCTGCTAEKPRPTEGLQYTPNSDGTAYELSGMGTATATDIVIADEYEGLPVTAIKARAFSGRRDLTSVTIPATIAAIGEDAFRDCEGLTAVHISDLSAWSRLNLYLTSNPLYYAHNLYLDGTLLTYLEIPADVEIIGRYAFAGCTSLTKITIPEGVTEISSDAFILCENVVEVTLPAGLKVIRRGAFSYCENLAGIAIPRSVQNIEAGVFEGCKKLSEITVDKDNATYYVRNNCLLYDVTMSKRVYLLVGGQNNSIPNSVTHITERAFAGREGLTEVSVPNGVKIISDGAFAGCENLTSISLPTSLTTIGSNAFEGCTGLTKIVIPDGVTRLDMYLFWDCANLTGVTIPATITDIETYVFDGCDNLTEITFGGTVSEWNAIKKSSNWKGDHGPLTVRCSNGTVTA